MSDVCLWDQAKTFQPWNKDPKVRVWGSVLTLDQVHVLCGLEQQAFPLWVSALLSTPVERSLFLPPMHCFQDQMRIKSLTKCWNIVKTWVKTVDWTEVKVYSYIRICHASSFICTQAENSSSQEYPILILFA